MSDVKVNYKELLLLKKELMKTKTGIELFFKELSREIAGRLLAKVIKRTPVGDYRGDIKRYKRGNKKKGVAKGDIMRTKKGKIKYSKSKTVNFKTKSGRSVSFSAKVNRVGGTLRRGWTAGGSQSGSQYAQGLFVRRSGNTYIVTIENSVSYAPYVEYGHRTRGGGFVPGRFMLTISVNELKGDVPAIINRKLRELLNNLGG